jgi:protein-L-isoaspartate(D-aspartate) O-methyltransferase
MLDFAAARRMMVDGQVRTADVTDRRLLAAMLRLPRERFVPEGKEAVAYLDRDLAVGSSGGMGRYLLKPMVLAKLIQAAEIVESDSVLDVGCATGYSTALIAQLAARVIGLEEDETLAQFAAAALSAEAIGNAQVVLGPLIRGWPAQAPYDAIICEGATDMVPKALLDQLKEGGRLVCLFGRAPGAKAMLYRRIDGECSGRPLFDAAAPLLPGFVRPPEFVF